MKQIYIEKLTESQNRLGIQNASTSLKNELYQSEPRAFAGNKGLNIFLIQNKGKGPPGRSRSPGVRGDPERPPDGEAVPPNLNSPVRKNPIAIGTVRANTKTDQPLVLKGRSVKAKGAILQLTDEPFGNTIHTEYNFLQILNTIFYKHLIFTIMKKQIFLLVFILIAAFASVNKSYGQATPGSAPRGISCVDDAIHPIAGKAYIYTAASNQTGNYTFWATKDFNFITTVANVTTTNMATTKLNSPTTTPVGTDLLTTSANYATSAVPDNVTITWSDAILSGTTVAAPTFVAVNQDGTCANNFKAWSILPIKAFTVDIKNIENATTAPLAYGAAESQCFDQVRGATYAGGTVQYNFGGQVLYFEVVAANFTTSWTPTFTLGALGSGQTAVIEWTYQNPTVTPWTAATVWNPAATVVTTAATSTTTGVSIYVRVTVTNSTFQGIAATPVTLTVDGVNSVGEWDIENNTLIAAGPLCNPGTLNDRMDAATQTLDPRPTVTPVAPSTPFVPGNETN